MYNTSTNYVILGDGLHRHLYADDTQIDFPRHNNLYISSGNVFMIILHRMIVSRTIAQRQYERFEYLFYYANVGPTWLISSLKYTCTLGRW